MHKHGKINQFYNYFIRENSITTKKDKSLNGIHLINTAQHLAKEYEKLDLKTNMIKQIMDVLGVKLNYKNLTEETRRGYVKQAKEYAEDCKIVLRNIRQDANNDIKKLELPEDDVKAGQEDVQEEFRGA